MSSLIIYNYSVKRSYVDFWRYGLIFKPIYELKCVYFEVYIFYFIFHLLDFCEYTLCIVYCTVYEYCFLYVQYTVLYAHGTIYCMHTYLQYILYRLIYIFFNMAGNPAILLFIFAYIYS